jgi:hypothetical protein
MLPIYVPSLNRERLMEKRRGTLWSMPTDVLKQTTLVLHSDEQAKQYENQIPKEVTILVSGLPYGVTRTRYFIGDTAKARGQDLFIMIDDDLNFYERINGAEKKMRAETYSKMLADIEEKLNSRYSLVGVSDRHDNFGHPRDYEENTFQAGVLAFRTEDFLNIRRDDVPILEDMYLTIALLQKGKPNIRLYWCMQGHCSGSNFGGCFEYRTSEMRIQANEMLAKMCPEAVKLRGEHNEKTITYWKKLYKMGTGLV